MLNNAVNGGAYIYQGDSLVVPVDTPDSLIQEEISQELIDSSFSCNKEVDTFKLTSLEGDIRALSIPAGELPKGWKAIQLRQALNIISGGTMAIAEGPVGRIFRSYHISQWREVSRFCGSCGGPNRDASSGEAARECSVCGRLEFPRISPAVITLITNDKDEAVLAHNKNFASGMYSLIAGFNEAGETLEETVAREVKEEINLKIKDIRYICSQPWPFPNSLMLGFTAHYDSGVLTPDGVEIEDARWFSRDNLPSLPGSASVSRHLINLWLESKI